MTIKFGTLLLLAGIAGTVSAQSPTAVENIYSQTGVEKVGATQLAHEFANWYSVASDGATALWPAMLSSVKAGNSTSFIEGVEIDANGVGLIWNAADKLISVNCDEAYLGRCQVLVTDLNGVNRDMLLLDQAPASISLSNYVGGTYVVGVAVDGKLVKTLKLILK